MKIKTLLLSSVVATGLSTGAMAADLGVLTSLDVCDAVNVTGLTISSSDNCLQISGGVGFEFVWGDYRGAGAVPAPGVLHPLADNGGVSPLDQDWDLELEGWLQFVATAESDFGPAKAVIKFETGDYATGTDGALVSSTSALVVDDLYVAIGDTTVLMFGDKGSIANSGGDTVYTWTGFYHDDDVRTLDLATVSTGGNVIQVTSDLGNGVDVGLGLEDLAGLGSLVGVINYAGDSLVAHATFVADDIFTGTVSTWAIHAGAEVTYDMYKFLVAFGYDDASSNYDLVASAQATFDMFTLAGSIGISEVAAVSGLEAGISVSAAVTDTVTVMLGANWDDHDTATATDELWNVEAGVKAEVTESVTLSGSVGVLGDEATATTVLYGSLKAAWAPGGGFNAAVELEGNENGAYSVTTTASKSFK